MAGRTNASPGDQFGRWTLDGFIDTGGNGDVWRVESNGEPAALKILHRTRGSDYARFQREVAICQELDPADLPILPVLDAELPNTPTRANRPWYVMPLARPLPQALAGSDVETKVAAIRSIAAGLHRLMAEHGVNHRDVKPENMFEFEGRYVIGDFGLARRPDDPHLSEPGKPVGPFHHLPTEVFVDEGEPDWERVDVFCLANSMWRLLAERPYPPRGQIRATEEDGLPRLFPDEPYIGRLAALIERSTARGPSDRPTLREFRDSIDEWGAARADLDAFQVTYEQEEARDDAVLRWLVDAIRREPHFEGVNYQIEPKEPSDVPGLTEGQLAEAFEALIERFDVEGEPHHVLGQREPAYFSGLYPTVQGLSRVTNLEALVDEATPLLRAFLQGEDTFTLPRANEIVELPGGVSRSAAEAYFQMHLLEQLGSLDFRRLNELGPHLTVINVRCTASGKDWLYQRGQ